MINSSLPSGPDADDNAVALVVEAGPGGALLLAAIAAAAVVLIWLAFYAFIFIARGGAV
jgi:hypothetical protein